MTKIYISSNPRSLRTQQDRARLLSNKVLKKIAERKNIAATYKILCTTKKTFICFIVSATRKWSCILMRDNTYVKCNKIKSRVKSLITLTWDIKNVACSSSNIAKCPKFIEELNLIRLSIAYTCKYQHITVKYLRSSKVGVFKDSFNPSFNSFHNTVAMSSNFILALL